MPSLMITGGKHIFYLREGRGDPVVFLHAFPLWGEMWQRQLKALGDKWSALAPDMRGFGYTQNAPGPYTIDSLAEEVKLTMDALEVTKKAVMVGLSMGGYIAMSFAVQFPDRVRALVLADTKAGADSEESKKAREELIALGNDHKKGGMDKVADKLMPKLLSEGTIEDDKDLVKQVHDWISRADPEAFEKAERALMTRPDRTPDLGKIQVPTLVMVGMADEVTPLSEAQKLVQGIPGALMQLIMGAGHLSNLERPNSFNAELNTFLTSLPALT